MAAANTEAVELGPPRPAQHDCDVLVVGGGPSGAAAGYWLASAGVDVLVVEKKHFPRVKTCGDGLTPRSVRQLEDMGLAEELAGYHRYGGLRANAFGRTLDLDWPDHPTLPPYGYVITRADLDGLVAARAEKAGAVVWQGAEAIEPLAGTSPAGTASSPVSGSSARSARSGSSARSATSAGGASTSGMSAMSASSAAEVAAGASPVGRGAPLRRAGGAVVVDRGRGTTTEVRAKYTIVADGSLSRFGRALGASRDKAQPQGMALRGYFESPRHAEPFIDSYLDIRDKEGKVVPGYGWIFPLGDGRVNVGVGLLSTSERWRQVNTSKLMEVFVEQAPASWCLEPGTSCGPPTGGRLPMGLAVGPRVGPDCVVTGDAAGSINPFNGEGIAYGYETGRMAAVAVEQALREGDPRLLGEYERALRDSYGLYYRVARAFIAMISAPHLMRICVNTGIYSRSIMEWLLRIMANILRPDEIGPAEAAYRAFAAIAKWAPER